MTQFEQSYTLAIRFLQEERLEEAKRLLEEILQHHPNQADVRWAAGLADVSLGYPHQAIVKWQGLSQAEHHLGLIEEKLPKYEQLFAQYNKALALLQQEKEEAAELFASLMEQHDDMPLPPEFYHGYVLALIVKGDTEKAEAVCEQLPLYVQHTEATRNIQQTLQSHLQYRLDHKQSSKKWVKPTAYIAGLAVAVIIGAFAMDFYQVTNRAELVTAPEPIIEQVDTSHFVQELDEYQVKIDQLEDEKLQIVAELADAHIQLESLEKKEQIFTDDEIAEEISWLTYQKGLAAYQSNDNEQAIEYLQQSFDLQHESYFADDTTYYLIQSLKKEKKEDAMAYVDAFLEHDSPHFVASPFYDDVLLIKAEMLLESADVEQARLTLETIIEQHASEWTAERAASLLHGLKEGTTDDTN